MSASGKIYNRDNLIDSFNGYSESKKSNALYIFCRDKILHNIL